MQALRGTQDILPDNIYKWNHVESVIKELCALYGYSEIRTPMFEDTKLFLRGIGDTTDVVAKEMYTFEDRGGRSITLRPENTAAVVRSYLEHKLYGDQQVHNLLFSVHQQRHVGSYLLCNPRCGVDFYEDEPGSHHKADLPFLQKTLLISVYIWACIYSLQ